MTLPRDTQKRLAMYSAIAGALVAGSAHAAVVKSPNVPFSLSDDTLDNGGTSTYFDIDGDGQDDFNLYVDYRSDCSENAYGTIGFYGQNGAQIAESDYYAGMISPGTDIPGALNFSSTGNLLGCWAGPGEFVPPARGFVAVSFMSGGNLHYGYLDVETWEGSLGVTFHAAYFEDVPETPLRASDRTSSIPVGGAIPLTLGVLALGAAALRRRRTQH
jgi:hypothetical protein